MGQKSEKRFGPMSFEMSGDGFIQLAYDYQDVNRLAGVFLPATSVRVQIASTKRYAQRASCLGKASDFDLLRHRNHPSFTKRW